MAEIKLGNIEVVSPARRLGVAFDLWMARGDAPGLDRELPIPAEGYANPLRAYMRLRRIGRTAASHKLQAFAIHDGRQFIGMATRQILAPKPNPLGTQPRTYAELSYWHHEIKKERMAVEIGCQVVSGLLEINVGPHSLWEMPSAWMVTLPDDSIKAAVCDSIGMERIDQPQRYDIDDGVTEPRQLWAENA